MHSVNNQPCLSNGCKRENGINFFVISQSHANKQAASVSEGRLRFLDLIFTDWFSIPSVLPESGRARHDAPCGSQCGWPLPAHGVSGFPHGRKCSHTGQNAPSGCRLVLFTKRLGASTNHLCAGTSRPARRTEGFGPRTRQPDARTGGLALHTDGLRPRTDKFAPCRDNLKRCRGRLEPRTDDLWPRTDKPKSCRDEVVCRREGIF